MSILEKGDVPLELAAKALEGAEKRPVIEVDYERYAHFLDDSDLSEDQKREFLQALWTIIVNFVDLGFGVHPLQQAGQNAGQEACGQVDEIVPESPAECANGVNSKEYKIRKKFERSTDAKRQPEEEGIGP